MAQEYAKCGNISLSVSLCQEIYIKDPSTRVSEMILSVCVEIYKYINDNQVTAVFNDPCRSKITKILFELCQDCLLLCDSTRLPEQLAKFKDFELHHCIFLQCDAGEYHSLIQTSQQIESNQESSSSSNPLFINTETSSPILHHKNTILEIPRYIDNGLVLCTETAMTLATKYLVDSCNASQMQPLSAVLNDKNKGSRANPSYSGRLLGQHLRENRFYQLSFRILQRNCEYDRRYQDLQLARETNREHLETYWEILSKWLQNVLSLNYIDEKLGLGCMVSLAMERAFSSFKVSFYFT